MGRDKDLRLAEAHACPIAEVADLLAIGGLTRAGRELTGPCPQCGGNDRFSINTQKGIFNCRRCGAKGDQVALVRFVRGMGFAEALDWLVGPAQEISPEERAAREKRDEENRLRKEAEAERYRQAEIARSRDMWEDCREAEDTEARGYMTLRGIPREMFAFPPAIRFHPAMGYWHGDGKSAVQIHKGPAMVAAIQGRDNRFSGIHITWLDLRQPKGKLKLPDPKRPGEFLPAKKIRGSKKGGAIRLRPRPLSGARLIMAEGIETTLSALVADREGAAFWCGVDLGNMAGARMLGKGRKYAGIPDLTDRAAFLPPDWVDHLTFILDGDSEPRLTRAKLMAGLRRARATRPGIVADLVPVPEGLDLNDVLMGANYG